MHLTHMVLGRAIGAYRLPGKLTNLFEGLRGSTKEYQKLDTTTQGDQIPRQSIEQIGMCLGTYS